MNFFSVVAGLTIFLLSIDLWANELDVIKKEADELHQKHPVSDKEHYYREVSTGQAEYEELSISIKNRILSYSKKVSALDEEIQSNIKTKDDLTKWKPRLNEFDTEYDRILKQMQIVVDHIVAHAYNKSALTGAFLPYCEKPEGLQRKFALAMDKLASMDYIVKARERNPIFFISSEEWKKYLSQRSIDPSKGLKCDTVISNVEHTIEKIGQKL